MSSIVQLSMFNVLTFKTDSENTSKNVNLLSAEFFFWIHHLHDSDSTSSYRKEKKRIRKEKLVERAR